MIARVSTFLAVTATLHLAATAAPAQTYPSGTFDLTGLVSAKQVSMPVDPDATMTSCPVHISDPSGLNPDLIITFYGATAQGITRLLGTGTAGHTQSVAIGTLSHSYDSGAFVPNSTVTYTVNINFKFKVNILDYSNVAVSLSPTANLGLTGVIPGTIGASTGGAIKGTVTRTNFVVGSGVVVLEKVELFIVLGKGQETALCTSPSGSKVLYTLKFTDWYPVSPANPLKLNYTENVASPYASIMAAVSSMPQ